MQLIDVCLQTICHLLPLLPKGHLFCKNCLRREDNRPVSQRGNHQRTQSHSIRHNIEISKDAPYNILNQHKSYKFFLNNSPLQTPPSRSTAIASYNWNKNCVIICFKYCPTRIVRYLYVTHKIVSFGIVTFPLCCVKMRLGDPPTQQDNLEFLCKIILFVREGIQIRVD